MNHERDPVIESLFAQAERRLEDSAFADRIMAQINRRRRRIVGIGIAIILALVVIGLASNAPVTQIRQQANLMRFPDMGYAPRGLIRAQPRLRPLPLSR